MEYVGLKWVVYPKWMDDSTYRIFNMIETKIFTNTSPSKVWEIDAGFE